MSLVSLENVKVGDRLVANYAGRPEVLCPVCDRQIGLVRNCIARHKWWPRGRASQCPGSGRKVEGVAEWEAAKRSQKETEHRSAEAERQREQEERRGRMNRLINTLAGISPMESKDGIGYLAFEGHRYEIREVE